MRTKQSRRLYTVKLVYENGITREVTVRALTQASAEKRALKFNRGAKGVKRDA